MTYTAYTGSIPFINNTLTKRVSTIAETLNGIDISGIESVLKEGRVNFDNFGSSDTITKILPIESKLAVSYGKLNSESIKMMDEKLKVLISGTVRALKAIPKDQLSWEKVQSVFSQNPLMERVGNSEIRRSDKIIKNRGVSAFKFDGSPDAAIVREIKSWFIKLVDNDQDILSDTDINIVELAELVAESGALVDSFEAVFYKKEYLEKTVIDVGVIRFPDIDNPFVKVYRIKLTAWSDCQRVLFVQEDKSGITGEFNSVNFRPRASVIDGLKEETKKKATEEAEALFR